jgi:heterodisulfide reductase subunit A
MDIYILFRDIRTYGFAEDYYREASNNDVKFIRYEPDDKPQVEAVEQEGRPVLRVAVTDPILGQKLAIDADYHLNFSKSLWDLMIFSGKPMSN